MAQHPSNSRSGKTPFDGHNRRAGVSAFKKRLAYQYGRRELNRRLNQWATEYQPVSSRPPRERMFKHEAYPPNARRNVLLLDAFVVNGKIVTGEELKKMLDGD